jgi:hypothetical protein
MAYSLSVFVESTDNLTLRGKSQKWARGSNHIDHGIPLEVVKQTEASRGFVLLPHRWMAYFRRLARDDERLPVTGAGLHRVTFAVLMLHQEISLSSPHSLFSLFLTTTGWEKECSQALPASLGHPVGATGSENGTLSQATLTDRHVHQG